MLKLTLCLLVAFSVSGAVYAGPLEDLKEEVVFQRALNEIDGMTRIELDKLIPALSSCAPLKPLDDGAGRYECNKQLIAFQLSGTRGRALGLMVRTIYRSSRLLTLNIPEVTGRADFDALVRRHAEVLEGFVLAVFLRSAHLSGGKA